jgi:hypothetical protein
MPNSRISRPRFAPSPPSSAEGRHARILKARSTITRAKIDFGMAAKKPKTPAPPKLADDLRGVALVDAVVARIVQGKGAIEVTQPRPMRPEVIAALRFANGAPLPPSLARFLAFDTTWLRARFPGWKLPHLAVATVARLVADTLAGFAQAFQPLPPGMPPGLALGLDSGSDSMRLLFLGKTDTHGEYPILGVDVDDEPNVVVAAPGFDVWLAQQSGLVRSLKAYKSDLIAQQRLNLGGRARLDALGLDERVTLDLCEGDVAADPAWVKATKLAPAPALPASTPPPLQGLSEAKLLKGWLEARSIGEDSDAACYLGALQERFATSSVWKASALDTAARVGDSKLVGELLAMGADPNKALMDAVRYYNPASEVVTALLDGNASAEAKSVALVAAAASKRVDLVSTLLAHGADVDAARGLMSALDAACHVHVGPRDVPIDLDAARAASLETAMLLLDRGAKVRSEATGSPLHWAVEQQNEPLVKLLLARGADADAPDADGDNALQQAWRLGATKVFDVLRAHGARRDLENLRGWCLDDVTSEDGCLPRKLDVRVPPGEAPQTLRLRLRLLYAPAGSPRIQLTSHAVAWVRALAWIAEHGCAGSDLHAPEAGHGLVLTDFTRLLADSPSTYSHDAPTSVELEAELSLGGVAPAALGLWLHALCHATSEVRVAELALVGDGPVRVDTAAAAAFIRGERRDPLRAFTGVDMSSLEQAPAGKIASVTLAGKPTERWAPATVVTMWNWLEHRARGLGGYASYVTETPGRGWAPEAPTQSFELATGTRSLTSDPAEMRAILMHAVRRYDAGEGRVSKVGWSLGRTPGAGA